MLRKDKLPVASPGVALKDVSKRPTAQLASIDAQISDLMASCNSDPLKHVMVSYPWDTDPTIQLVRMPKDWRNRFPYEYGPDGWACEFLDQWGEEIKKRGFDGMNAVEPIRFTTASGHGIGKSVLVAWIIKFIMDTRPFSKGTITATTDTQLRTKTWAELGKWHRLSLTNKWFSYSSSRGNMALRYIKKDQNGNSLDQEWFCTAQTSKEENSEAFAGQHAANATSFYVFDEASGVPDKIFEVRQGGLTDGEPMVFDFGNPTRNTGMFFENCVGRFRHRYIVRTIDSREVAVTNKKQHQEWIDDYGIDSDFVKVRVLGQFPSQGSLQFIPTEFVQLAQARQLPPEKNAPLVIGVDVARRGDDESVLLPRVGYDARSWPAQRYRGLDTPQLVGKITEMVREFRALGVEYSMIFVDMGNTGAAIYDLLSKAGYRVMGVWFSGKPIDGRTYKFKVDEMYGRMRDALKDRLCIPHTAQPNGVDLQQQLTQREFGYTNAGNKIQLESKEAMKDRLGSDVGSSPDVADALALTFAQDVDTIQAHGGMMGHNGGPALTTLNDYDPLARQ